jgi:hypothetical protein
MTQITREEAIEDCNNMLNAADGFILLGMKEGNMGSAFYGLTLKEKGDLISSFIEHHLNPEMKEIVEELTEVLK